jgi:endonuclease YncB( thermonuclease family)
MTSTLIAFAACVAIDGDTIRCGQEKVRLARVDAPEMSEPAGPKSADWLRLRIEGHRVVCVVTGRERHGRLLGECFVGTGKSLSDQLLDAGVARKYRGRK